MIDTDQPPPSATPAGPPKPRPRRMRRALLLTGILACGMALGAGGLAMAATMPGAAGWRQGAGLAFIQRLVRGELDGVGATAAQEARVHDIVASTFAGVAPDPERRAALRKQATDLLRAPVVDRAAVEKLRAEQIAELDATSRKVIAGLLDIADQLTPQQRVQLADRAEARMQQRMQHGPSGGPHGGPPFMGGGMRP